MKYLKLIIFTYLLALIAIPISNFFKIDVQLLYRLPGINIRIFDLALLLLFTNILSSNFFKTLKNKSLLSNVLNILILLFGFFLIFNFIRTAGLIELNAQLALFGAYLAVFIVYYINDFFSKDDIIQLLKKNYFIITIIMLFYYLSLLFLYLSGQAMIFEDVMGQRVLFEIVGVKEVIGVYNVSLFVLLMALFRKEIFSNNKIKEYFSLIFLSIFIIYSFYSFHRGTVFGILICIIVYILYMTRINFKRNLIIISSTVIIFFIFFSLWNSFVKGSVDPIENLRNTIEFTLDTENPQWDKGREFSRMLGLQIWSYNFWFGMGFNYMDLVAKIYNIATPHHLVITSLMYNGLIGSILFLGVYSIFYIKTIKLTKKLFRGIIPKEEVVLVVMLVTTSFLWLVVAFTQEIQTERYSSALQYIFFGAIIKIDDYYELQSKNR